MPLRRLLPTLALTILAALAFAPGSAFAQGARPADPSLQDPAPPKPEMRESCPGLVSLRPPVIRPAAFTRAALAADQARLTFIGHATFLIESPKGVRIATDYNDYVKPPVIPDIATMNRAHTTHYTLRPDPGIRYVLHGWRDDGAPARIDLDLDDVHVRNLPTNLRDWGGGTLRNANSIFVFEVGSLCIAHLGHLHHTLTQQQLDDLGHVDVVLFPVDGNVTLDIPGMLDVLEALKAPVMIPMHFLSQTSLDRFMSAARTRYAVEDQPVPSVVLSKTALPAKQTIMVLPGR